MLPLSSHFLLNFISQIIADWVFILGPQTYEGDAACSPCYEYAAVSDPFDLTLWVLARDPATFNAQYNATVFQQLTKLGFTTDFNKPIVWHV